MSVERIQGFGPGVLYVFLGIFEVYGIRSRRAATQHCEPRNMRPHRDFQVLVHVTGASFVALERSDKAAQVADETEISA